MRFAILVVVSLICSTICCCGYSGCSCTPEIDDSPPQLTAEMARDALLDLIRNQPDLFAGNPDPDRLTKISLEAQRDGTFHWGRFVIDPGSRTYSADLNTSGPGEAYFYNGKFELRWRQWTASKPDVQRLHQPH